MAKKTLLLTIGVAGLLFAVSACGDDGNDAALAADIEIADSGDTHEDEEEDVHENFDFGEPADPADADRVIEVATNDDFSFNPPEMAIAAGETITFRVSNSGNLAHDFTLGRSDLQDAHDIEMAEGGGLPMSDEPNALFIEPGETKELTWHFTESGDVLIGCHVPGHYAAGMKAEIAVEG